RHGVLAVVLHEALPIYRHRLALNVDGDLTRCWSRRWTEVEPQTLQVWVVEDPTLIWQQVTMMVAFLAGREAAVSPTEMMRLLSVDRKSTRLNSSHVKIS